MSIPAPLLNNKYSPRKPLKLNIYQHEYYTDDIDDDEEILYDFTENNVHLPRFFVPTPSNGPFADAISSSTMNFMALLETNNHPGFIQLYKDEWIAAKKDYAGFIDTVGQLLYTDIDEDVSWKNMKVIIRPPIKTNNENGMKEYHTSLHTEFRQVSMIKSFQMGHFISVEPGNRTTVSVGMASMSDEVLNVLREIIFKEGHLLNEVLSTEFVKQVFGPNHIGTELLDTTSILRHAPYGFFDQGINSDLLRYHHFLVIKQFDDVDVVSPGFLDKILDVYAALSPFMDLLCEWEIDLTRRLGKPLLYTATPRS